MRANMTNGETSGIIESTITLVAFGATTAICATRKPATTGMMSGATTLPMSSVRLINAPALAYISANCRKPMMKKAAKAAMTDGPMLLRMEKSASLLAVVVSDDGSAFCAAMRGAAT